MERALRITYRTALYGFALIGFVFVSVFVAMHFGLLNVRGSIDGRNAFFLEAAAEASTEQGPASSAAGTPVPVAAAATPAAPGAPVPPAETAQAEQQVASALDTACIDPAKTSCAWNDTPQWTVIASALAKDAPVLARVSQETGVPARMVAAVVVPEQVRFFTSNREVFKRWFEPMKLLGSLSQFSLGVSGIKQATAARAERYANDPSSPFYPGPGFAALVAYPPDADRAAQLYDRLTDEKDHYYSYLYTALFVREVEAQWLHAGFDISQRPDVIVTLFNIGFDRSAPHATPAAGGATVTLGGTSYTYGTLGAAFYWSEELARVFPRELQTLAAVR